MYEIGKIYTWQNLVKHAYLNGTDTTVMGAPSLVGGEMAQRTDTVIDGKPAAAGRGALRPKNPPSGEQKMRALFEPKPVAA